MPVINPRKSLYIPGEGEVSLEQKDVIPINIKELRMLADLHEFAHKHQINIFCKRCERAITGQNNDSEPDKRPSVSCQCREWVFIR